MRLPDLVLSFFIVVGLSTSASSSSPQRGWSIDFYSKPIENSVVPTATVRTETPISIAAECGPNRTLLHVLTIGGLILDAPNEY